jgi:sulfatase maturation enzyme AslB (radical SAM superfamily)
MNFSTAKDAINHYMEIDNEFDFVTIEFFGGEPFIAFSLIKDIVEWMKSRTWKKFYKFLIGTNGTILTDHIKNWLLENKDYIIVTFSIDGNKTAHDISRDNSYDALYSNIPFFKKNWPDQPAKMTICKETIPYMADGIIELEEMGLYFTANTVFENIWGNKIEKKQLLETYNTQLERLVEYYSKRSDLYPVYPILCAFPDYLGNPGLFEKEGNEIKRYCGASHEMVVVDVDGEKYPCHRFLPWITGRPAPKYQVNCQTTWKPDKCSGCKLILSCPTCAGFNWEVNHDTGYRTTFHCEAYKLEVLASAKLEALKTENIDIDDLKKINPDEAQLMRNRMKALLDLINNGI